MAAKLKDIAERAGVTSATVSMALNNKKGVSKEKAQLIRRIAEEMGYFKIPVPDIAGSIIHFIQILKPSQKWDDSYKIFIADYLEGLTTEAAKSGLTIEVKTYETENMGKILENLNEFVPYGTIFLGAGLYPEDIEILRNLDSPSVFIDVCYSGMGVDFIDMDNKECVYQIIQHLHSLGHRSIGIVQGEEKTPNFTLREEAFFSALESTDLTWNQEYYFVINKDQNLGKDQMLKLLKGKPNLPTALFCVNDMIAYNCIHACQELDIRIPGDLAVAGFDDLPASKIMRPRLTTVNVPKKEISKRALQTLLDRVRAAKEKPPEKTLIGGWLIKREST